jgi:hypothetical protein
MKFAIACALTLVGLCFGQDATRRTPAITGPEAVATNADASYCFARVRGLDPGRQPASYIDLQLRVRISYRNVGTRPLILPLERERAIYYGFKPEKMSALREDTDLFESAAKVMKDLPAGVSRDSPVSPSNDVFTVIPARGEMTPPLLEEVTLPVNRMGLFRRYPDLRGHKVYIKLQFAHLELSAALKANLTDWWSSFGVPWTGTLMTNTFVVSVPANPTPVGQCIDPPAHLESSRGQPVQSGK